jgi:hypothetical protein
MLLYKLYFNCIYYDTDLKNDLLYNIIYYLSFIFEELLYRFGVVHSLKNDMHLPKMSPVEEAE